MKPWVSTLSLLVLLILTTLTLGLTFEGAGSQGASHPSPSNVLTLSANPGSSPQLAVKAETVGQDFLYSAAGFGQIPRDMLVPIAGLRFVLTRLLPSPNFLRFGRPPTYFVTTDAFGVALTTLPQGNYTVRTGGSNFNFSTTIRLVRNLTTTLELDVLPVYNSVNSVSLINQDTVSGVEPTSTIFLNVEGVRHYGLTSSYQLIGFQSDVSSYVLLGTGPLLTINASLIGYYGAQSGTWIVMAPKGAFQLLPSRGVFLVEYETNSRVSYGAG